jgi:surface protein
MSQMFCECFALAIVDFTNFNTSKVSNLSQMFFSCRKLTMLDLSSFTTASFINTSYMFNGCTSLKTIYVSPAWNVQHLTAYTSTNMFANCSSIVGSKGTVYSGFGIVDNRYARIDQGPASPAPGFLTEKPAS